jgi:hypothetical protein
MRSPDAASEATPGPTQRLALVTFVSGQTLKVAEHFFCEGRQSGSHVIFTMPWAGDPRVNLQKGSDGDAKAYQVKQLLTAIDRFMREQSDEGKTDV